MICLLFLCVALRVAFGLSLGSHPNIPKVLAFDSSVSTMPILMELAYCDMAHVISSISVRMVHKIRWSGKKRWAVDEVYALWVFCILVLGAERSFCVGTVKPILTLHFAKTPPNISHTYVHASYTCSVCLREIQIMT